MGKPGSEVVGVGRAFTHDLNVLLWNQERIGPPEGYRRPLSVETLRNCGFATCPACGAVVSPASTEADKRCGLCRLRAAQDRPVDAPRYPLGRSA